jgi:hypothetical protein
MNFIKLGSRAALLLFIKIFIIPFSNAQIKPNTPWQAQWINCMFNQSASNSWTIARNTVYINQLPTQSLVRMAVDSKYWMWINGEIVVREGNLKRGPNPTDTYYDEIDVKKYLKLGQNTFAILYWYFGKDGFSHTSSGKSGLIFELFLDSTLALKSDKSWFTMPHPAYRAEDFGTKPNWRLAESNIVFDASRDSIDWKATQFNPPTWSGTMVCGNAGDKPWYKLVPRPIPLWKDYGLNNYVKIEKISTHPNNDTIKAYLPYNAQITPYLKVKANKGLIIEMLTDNYMGGGEPNVKSTYLTKQGWQDYESFGWMNGHIVYYIVPKLVEIEELKYRETGYDTEFVGYFDSDNKDLNTLWEKSRRTLYITMRDSYMDCPDRESSVER